VGTSSGVSAIATEIFAVKYLVSIVHTFFSSVTDGSGWSRRPNIRRYTDRFPDPAGPPNTIPDIPPSQRPEFSLDLCVMYARFCHSEAGLCNPKAQKQSARLHASRRCSLEASLSGTLGRLLEVNGDAKVVSPCRLQWAGQQPTGAPPLLFCLPETMRHCYEKPVCLQGAMLIYCFLLTGSMALALSAGKARRGHRIRGVSRLIIFTSARRL
jgi:hypothetical protein